MFGDGFGEAKPVPLSGMQTDGMECKMKNVNFKMQIDFYGGDVIASGIPHIPILQFAFYILQFTLFITSS